MRHIQVKFALLCLLLSPASISAQLWSGLIDSARATDWTGAGVTGGIPSGTWTQCGSTIAAGATGATINAAISACAANHYVLLGAGTFNISDAGLLISKSNVALRGSGADQTLLVFAASTFNACSGGYHTAICLNGSAGAYWVSDANFATWTAGYSRGTTVITLSTVTGLVANQSIIGLDQCSLGNSGYPCSSNAEVDNGNYFDCDVLYNAGSTNGCAVNGPDGGNQRLNRPQNELFQVSNVNAGASQVTLIGSLRAPNWNSAQTPAVFAATNPVQYSGVENLSIDMTSDPQYGVVGYYTANCWVKGVRIIKPTQAAIWWVVSVHATTKDNYIYGTSNAPPGADSFSLEGTATSDLLVQNNIVQWSRVCTSTEGADTGSVYAYNFCINDYSNNAGLYAASFQHAGNRWQLYEGNVQNSYFGENFHGPKMMQTLYRNFVTGWESCANGSVCGSSTFKGGGGNGASAVRLMHHSRYHNIIANVLGTPSYHNSYSTTNGFADLNIYEMGSNDLAPADPIVGQTTYRWGNYDTVTAAVRWCGNSSDTGWSTTCASTSEVPTGFATYPQPIPTVGDLGTALPASLYLSSKPSWFGSIAWPAIGPDVTGGNVGQCTGTWGPTTPNVAGQYGGVPATSSSQCTGTTLTSAWAGHINAIPAMNCFLVTMGGPPDGTNASALSFNADTCYAGGSGTVATPTFSPVAGNYATTQNVTISTSTGGATLCYTTDGSTPTANGAGTCTHGTTYSTPVVVASSLTLKAVGSLSGDSDSAVGSAAYTIGALPPARSGVVFTKLFPPVIHLPRGGVHGPEKYHHCRPLYISCDCFRGPAEKFVFFFVSRCGSGKNHRRPFRQYRANAGFPERLSRISNSSEGTQRTLRRERHQTETRRTHGDGYPLKSGDPARIFLG